MSEKEEVAAFWQLIEEKAQTIAKKFNIPPGFANPLFIPDDGNFKKIEEARDELLKELEALKK